MITIDIEPFVISTLAIQISSLNFLFILLLISSLPSLIAFLVVCRILYYPVYYFFFGKWFICVANIFL